MLLKKKIHTKYIDSMMQKLDEFIPINLGEMDRVKLMDRIDTKYIMNIHELPVLLDFAKHHYRILEIDNRRMMQYSTKYFDTSDLSMYKAHHNGKLNRYKIRNREYVDSSESFLEIKFKSNKGRTSKKRINASNHQSRFTSENQKFIEHNTPFDASELKQSLRNRFSRITLVHKKIEERITIDMNLVSYTESATVEMPSLAIIEIKQSKQSQKSDFVKLLRQRKHKPTGMSKYCIATAILNKEVKFNLFKSKIIALRKICGDNTHILN